MVFTFIACADLKRIWEALAMPLNLWSASTSENLLAAEEFASGFGRHCKLLADNSEIGTERGEILDGLRSSMFGRYVIFYRVRGGRVEVLRVLRAGQDTQSG